MLHMVGNSRSKPGPSGAQLERDAALGRISRTRRWMIVGAAALSAALAAVVSSAAPGRTIGHKAGTATSAAEAPRASSSTQQLPPLESPSQLGLQGPDQAPGAGSQPNPPSQSVPPASQSVPSQPSTPSQPPVTSGGS